MTPWFIYLLLPFAIAALGLRIARSMTKGRWLTHVVFLSLMIFGAPLAYIWMTTPSDGMEPGPGAGLAFPVFLSALIFAVIMYVRRARNLRVTDSTAIAS
ncbi:MAG: hypothetical protein QOH67_1064 [Hyphomicrobiales bacterium]|jgi:Na+-driven multidrug efflux pump|nr:hypothetical protein [Hyphomicrobiales bacterium]